MTSQNQLVVSPIVVWGCKILTSSLLKVNGLRSISQAPCVYGKDGPWWLALCGQDCPALDISCNVPLDILSEHQAELVGMELHCFMFTYKIICRGFKLPGCLSLWCLVLWINHLLLVWQLIFGKSILNESVCKVDGIENSFSSMFKYISIVNFDRHCCLSISVYFPLKVDFSTMWFYFSINVNPTLYTDNSIHITLLTGRCGFFAILNLKINAVADLINV